MCKRLLTIVFLLGLMANSAYGGWDYNLSGFASFAVGKSNRDAYTFFNYDADWSFRSDSILGLQGVVKPTERLTFTAQGVLRGYDFQDTRHPETELEWLFASYQLSDNSRLRFGRLRMPLEHYSQSLEIGYSYLWARPPVDTYAFQFKPFTHFQGIDYVIEHLVGEFDLQAHFFAGQSDGQILSVNVDVSRAIGFNLLTRWHDFSVRFASSVLSSDLRVSDPNGYMAEVRKLASYNPHLVSMLDQFDLHDDIINYYDFAFEWQPDSWSVVGEIFYLLPPKQQLSYSNIGWYLSLAKSYDSLTPYVVLGGYRSRFGSIAFERIQAVLDSPKTGNQLIDGAITQAASTTKQMLDAFIMRQRTTTLGLRYDFHAQAAFKVELQHFRFGENSSGLFIYKKTRGSYKDAADATLLTFVVDVIF